MGYLVWFGIVALVFAVMHYFTELGTKQKGLISVVLTLIISGAVAYNIAADRERDKILATELKFRGGETLQCRGIDVNTTTFDYSVGTQSFIGLKGTKHYQQIINARECE
jgi:membrane protein implicated in regulation of membrane protease activity